jgi:hypothetical protein
MIDLYEEFEDRRDEFEILAFHNPGRPTFDALEPDLTRCKHKYWKGRDLPFPILLDSTGDTIRELGVDSYPTVLLIDPQGRLVKHGEESQLRQELMKTDAEVKKQLARLAGAKPGRYAQVAKEVAKAGSEKAAWALMLSLEDSTDEKRIVAVLPLLAKMKSEAGHFFLLGKQGLSSESKKVRSAAIEALKQVEEPNEMLPYWLSQAHEREQDASLKATLSKWLEELAAKARAAEAQEEGGDK